MKQGTSSEELIERSNSVLIENYARLPIAMSKGSGAELFDSAGKRYIDLFAGFGACGVLGHSHPEIAEVVSQQARTLTCHGNFFTNEPQIKLAERLTRELPNSKVFFCHSGTEAVETALKMVRKAAPEKYKVICFEHSFHGRTMGSLSLCPESFQQGFEPMLAGATRVPHGDIEAVEAAIDEQTAAVFIEAIQGEGGVNVPEIAFMQKLRQLCTERNIALVCDEVWTAPGRTGKFFAWQHFDITPDITTMAKSLGAGLPLGATLAAGKYADVLTPGSHGCTMGGNPLCTAAGVAGLAIMDRDALIARAESLGAACRTYFAEAKLAFCQEIRGKGLMWGVQLDEAIQIKDCMLACLEIGVCVGVAKKNTLRFAPPMNIPENMLFEGLEKVVTQLRQVAR